jgi:hypothetical protein
MNDLSLHILDLTENSLAAGADDIVITLITRRDRKILVIRDNGRGTDLPSEQLLDPFYTTRTTRKVGLGLALMEHLARLCEGSIKIVPIKPRGMVVIVSIAAKHWDLPPDGKLADTALALIAANPHCRFKINYNGAGRLVRIDSNDFVGLRYGEKKRQIELVFK